MITRATATNEKAMHHSIAPKLVLLRCAPFPFVLCLVLLGTDTVCAAVVARADATASHSASTLGTVIDDVEPACGSACVGERPWRNRGVYRLRAEASLSRTTPRTTPRFPPWAAMLASPRESEASAASMDESISLDVELGDNDNDDYHFGEASVGVDAAISRADIEQSGIAPPPSAVAVVVVDDKDEGVAPYWVGAARMELDITDRRDDLDEKEEEWRRALPAQLRRRRGMLHRISIRPTGDGDEGGDCSAYNKDGGCRACELFLLGTSHVSRDSCDDARLLVEHVRPHCLFVELCHQRLALLLSDDGFDDQVGEAGNHANEGTGDAAMAGQKGGGGSNGKKRNGDRIKSGSIASEAGAVRESNPNISRALSVSAALFAKIQMDCATKLGVSIGGEFRESCRAAMRQQKDFEANVFRRKMEWIQCRQQYWCNESVDYARKATAVAVDERIFLPATLSAERHKDGQIDHNDNDLHGCAVVLGDRPIRLTFIRVWESLSLLGKIRLVLSLIWSSLRQSSEKEMREWMDSIMNDPGNDLLTKTIEQLERYFPTVGEVLIHERDRYMAAKLVQTARVLIANDLSRAWGGQDWESRSATSSSQKGKKPIRIVAIVGAGHCTGMCNLLRHGGTHADETPEDVLRSLVETNRLTVEGSPELRSLTTDVTELHFS